MKKVKRFPWEPDYVLPHPGEHLREHLKAIGMKQTELAIWTGIARSAINNIIAGRRDIGPVTALALEGALKIDAEYWLRLQASHDLSKARKAAKR